MAKTKAWFEGELRRMLGFDEVEEIARIALDSFPVSQPVELRQYLEQFLGQSKEVENLCSELSARRRGASPATAATSQAAKHPPSAATNNDFWGDGGATTSGGTTGASTRASGRSAGSSPPQTAAAAGRGRGKGKGKVYQKAAAEADFWGGGTTSGRSKPSSPPPAGKSGGNRGGTAPPAVSGTNTVPPSGPARATPAPAAGAVPTTNTRSGGGVTGSTARGSAGGVPSAATKSAAVKQQQQQRQPVVAPAAVTDTTKTGGGRKAKGGGKAPQLPSGNGGGGGGASAGATAAGTEAAARAAAAAAAPEWSGVTCLCMGKTHDVVTNCTSCGKIACVKEGGYGCSFCGSALPSTGREPRRIGAGSSSSEEKNGGGGVGPQSAALKEALERKDRLLLFDRTSASRTRVLDDQGDYFTSHNWLSQGEREKGEAEEKARRDDAASRRGARRQVKMSIDIMGRRVIETQAPEETKHGDAGGEAGNDGSGVGTGNDPKTQGISLDFGSSSTGGVGNSGGPRRDNTADEEGAPRTGTEGQTQRVSLENTGLRGRAKEVYDVMRANLDKKSRKRPGGAAAAGGVRKAGVVAEKSRVSLWRVQHDVDSDDLVRPDQPGGGGGVSGGFEKFEPADELACAR